MAEPPNRRPDGRRRSCPQAAFQRACRGMSVTVRRCPAVGRSQWSNPTQDSASGNSLNALFEAATDCFHHRMPDWETFAVVTGGVAGALVGLFFVAVSIQTQKIMRSIEVRNRAGQVLVDFAVVMLTAVLLSVPSQSPRTLGAELSALGLVFGILLELLERRAKSVDPVPLARLLKRVNANVVVAGGLVATGALLLAGIDWAMFVVVPTTCFALISGLTSAWLPLTRLPD